MMSLRRLCVSTKNGDKICQTKAEIIEMIKQCAALPKGDELWVSRNEKPYPCLSILIKENYACVHYFNNNEGEIWQSCGDLNKKVTFLAGKGDREWTAPEYAVVPLEKAVSCIEEFGDTLERPNSIA